MSNHMPTQPPPTPAESKSQSPIFIRIGSIRFEMDDVPRLPRWLASVLTSGSVAAIACITHHLHYWR